MVRHRQKENLLTVTTPRNKHTSVKPEALRYTGLIECRALAPNRPCRENLHTGTSDQDIKKSCCFACSETMAIKASKCINAAAHDPVICLLSRQHIRLTEGHPSNWLGSHCSLAQPTRSCGSSIEDSGMGS